MAVTGKRKIQLATLLLAVITIPLHNNWNSWAIILFCLSTPIAQPIRESFKKISKDHYWKLSAAFFLWMAATYFWDTSGGFTIKELEPKASFLFLPLAMTIMPRLSPKQLMLACYAFVAAVVAVCLICLAKSFMEYLRTEDTRVFFYHYLGFQMGLNAVYLSNYCVASIGWLLYFGFLYTGDRITGVPAAVTIATSAFLFLMMFLLSSKMSLVLAILLCVFMTVYIGYRRQALLKTFVILCVAAGVAWTVGRNLGYLNWRIQSTKWKAYSGPQDDNNGLALRITTWTSALELIKERPLLGYGLQGSEDALVEKYREKNFQPGIPEKYNSHNQFLETTLRSGAIGLLLLLLLTAIAFFTALRKRAMLQGIMVLHFVLASMVETTLEYQQELVFYLFFIFLFYYHCPSNNPATE